MSRWQSLLILGFAGLSVVASTASRQQPPPPTAPVPVGPVYPEPAAYQALDRAIAALDPARVQWLRTTIWQQVAMAPVSFQVEGLYLSGPGHRLRLELQVRYENAQRRMQVVSDGHTLWQAEQDGDDWRVFQVDMQRVRAVLDHPDMPATTRAEFCRSQLYEGPAPLLQGLRQGMVFTNLKRIRWQGRDVWLLSGIRQGAVGQETWPEGLPRQCRLVLDAHSFWPHHVEWWGPAPPVIGDVRLVQLEFRQPCLGEPQPEGLFSFNVGAAAVPDRTQAWTEQLQKAARP